MSRIFFLSIILLLSYNYDAQNSAIIVKGKTNVDSSIVSCVITHQNKIIASKTDGRDYYFIFDSLKTGDYRILLYHNNRFAETRDVFLNQGQRYYYYPKFNRDSLPKDSLSDLFIWVYEENLTNENVIFELLLNDTLAMAKKYHPGNSEINFYYLTPGNYNLKIYVNNLLHSTYYGIKITDKRENQYSVTIYNNFSGNEIKPEKPDTLNYEDAFTAQTTPCLLYGNPIFEKDESSPIAGNFKLGFFQEFYYRRNKYLNFAPQYGFTLEAASFNAEWDTSILRNRSRENYVGGKFTMGFVSKITTYNFKITDSDSHKFSIDLGIQYHLPIFFHHTVAKGKTVVRKYFIHQFTDLTAIVRLSYNYIGFIGEARLMDFLYGDYPELPRFAFGICVPLHGE